MHCMAKKNATGGLIYSTEHGKMCPSCKKAIPQCNCSSNQTSPKSLPNGKCVEVRRETKGRKGSGVIVVRGVPLSKADLHSFATHLKQKCGTGGTVKDGAIEIQGENCELVMEEIAKQGWKVKKIGG
jgi:translation initiation factor 1